MGNSEFETESAVIQLKSIIKEADRKNKKPPGLWLAETFSTSHLKPLNGIQHILTGSKISASSNKFVFFGSIGGTRWPPGLWLIHFGIPMGTNCAPLLADISLYSYEAEFIQSLLSTGRKRLASQFNFTYRNIDDVLSINNPDFENYLGQMYPPELEIKDTTKSNTSASYLDLLLSIGRDGQLHTSLYDKRDDFNFHITNFPFLSSNIPSSPAYGVFISQLIRYARASSSYECFILRAMRLSNKLLGQGYEKERLRSSLRKFYGRYGDLIKQYEAPLSRMLHGILDDDHLQWHPPLIRHYTNFDHITDLDLITEFDFLPNCERFP